MSNTNLSDLIFIPQGSFSTDDEAAAQRRRELARSLSNGDSVSVNQQGEMIRTSEIPTGWNTSEQTSKPYIIIPAGICATNFYWYERDRQLFEAEKSAMAKFFPQFQMDKLSDGRLSWVGAISTNNIRQGGKWILQSIYDNNHPHNNTYGGSIKVYTIEPDLNDLVRRLGNIPHILRDSSDNLYLCTARQEDFRATVEHSTTAASALAWAVKWITVFELWLQGDVTTDQFQGHVF